MDLSQYNTRVQSLQDQYGDLKTIDFAFPEYVYRMVEEVAEADGTSKTAALIKMIRIGDFAHYVQSQGYDLTVDDGDSKIDIRFE